MRRAACAIALRASFMSGVARDCRLFRHVAAADIHVSIHTGPDAGRRTRRAGRDARKDGRPRGPASFT